MKHKFTFHFYALNSATCNNITMKKQQAIFMRHIETSNGILWHGADFFVSDII